MSNTPKKRQFANRSNYIPKKGKKPKGKSMTVQGDVISVSDLLKRYAMGQPLQGREGQFVEDADLDDEDGEKFRHMDPTDQEYVLEGMKAKRSRLKNLEKEYEDELKRRQAEKLEPPKQPGNEDAPKS